MSAMNITCFLSANMQATTTLQSVIISVTNTNVNDNDIASLQATLPAKVGCLRLQLAVEVVPLAFSPQAMHLHIL